MKKIISAILLVCLIFSLTALMSCSLGNSVTREEAEQAISNLLGTLGEANYELAATYMHPEANATAESLENLDNELKNMKIDLSKGVKVKTVTGFSQVFYNSQYKGSSYELTFTAEVGERNCTIIAKTVRNSNGFGIYSIKIS